MTFVDSAGVRYDIPESCCEADGVGPLTDLLNFTANKTTDRYALIEFDIYSLCFQLDGFFPEDMTLISFTNFTPINFQDARALRDATDAAAIRRSNAIALAKKRRSADALRLAVIQQVAEATRIRSAADLCQAPAAAAEVARSRHAVPRICSSEAASICPAEDLLPAAEDA